MCDSVRAGELTLALTRARTAGIKAALLNLSASAIDVFQLEAEFEAFEGERDAINAFFPNRRAKPYDILSFAAQQARELGEVDEFIRYRRKRRRGSSHLSEMPTSHVVTYVGLVDQE